MNHFTSKSINKDWFKGVTLKEFIQAHAQTGVSKTELHDAYAQLKAITEPQILTDESKANAQQVANPGPDNIGGDNFNQ